MTEEPRLVSRDSLETTAHWFIVVAGLVYGTGFLTVFTFLNRFGVTEAGSEFFRAKYIFVGMLHLLLPAIVGVPVFALLYLRRESLEPRVYLPSIILTANLVLVFYIYVLFAPPGFLEKREFVIPVLFGSTFGGIAIIRWFERPIENLFKLLANVIYPDDRSRAEKWWKKALDNYRNYSRWVLCVAVILGAGIYSLWGLFGLLGKIIWAGRGSGAYVLLLIVLLMGWLVHRTTQRAKERADRGGMRAATWAITACLVGALYYFSVLIFAVRVYPYVPAVRGGGDYSESPKALLHFRADSVASLPPGILASSAGGGLTSREMMILEITSTSIFVADPAEAGGPKCWRGPRRPRVKIVELRLDEVQSIAYSNQEIQASPLWLPECTAQQSPLETLGKCCPAF